MEEPRQHTDLYDYIPWVGLLVFAWIGSTIAGGILGIVVSLLEDPTAHESGEPFVSMLLGSCLCALLSGVAVISVGTFSWIFRWPRNPRLLVLLAVAAVGVLLGIRCDLSFETWCVMMTMTIGLGAVVGGEVYLFGTNMQAFAVQRSHRPRFSLAGLTLRVTAAALLILLWNEMLNFELFLMW